MWLVKRFRPRKIFGPEFSLTPISYLGGSGGLFSKEVITMKYEEIVDKVTHHRYIPKGKVRFLGRDFYKMVLLGSSENEIAYKLGHGSSWVGMWFRSVRREIYRLDRRIVRELAKAEIPPGERKRISRIRARYRKRLEELK